MAIHESTLRLICIKITSQPRIFKLNKLGLLTLLIFINIPGFSLFWLLLSSKRQSKLKCIDAKENNLDKATVVSTMPGAIDSTGLESDRSGNTKDH